MNRHKLQEQVNIHLLVLVIALAIPVAGASFINHISLMVTTVLVLQTLLLAMVCCYHISHIKKYSRCCHYCLRIKTEHNRVIKNQAYKINRLSIEEQQLLQYILQIEQSQYAIHIDDRVCYRSIERIMHKLEIPLHESPFDVDWKLITG